MGWNFVKVWLQPSIFREIGALKVGLKKLKIASISHHLSFAKIDLLAETPAEYTI